MEENKKRDNPENDSNKANTNNNIDTSKSSGFNWMDKLKPSNKNKLIMQKYKNLGTLETQSNNNNNNILNSFASPVKDKNNCSSNTNLNNSNNTSNKKQGLNCDSSLLSSCNNINNQNNNLTSNKNLNFNKRISLSNSKNNLSNEIFNILNNPNSNNNNNFNNFNNNLESEFNLDDEIQKARHRETQSKLKSACLGISVNISKDSLISENENNKTYLAKWNKCVFENKLTLAELNSIHDQSQVILKNNIDNTVLSDDLENINNEMEERMKLNLCENGFLKQLYHSIIPFFLIQNKEIHRMCLSDYELKLFYKTYNKKKSESERKNPYESYRQGIIKFYKGKYLDAYSHFKSAHMKKESDLNIAKWLAFTSIILLMCNKKIDFTNIKNIKVETNKDEDEEKDNSIIFPCCSSRKNENKIKSLQTSSIIIQNNFFFNNGNHESTKNLNSLNNYFSNNNGGNGFNFNISKISQINLAKEITKLLKMLVKKENKNVPTTASERNNNSNNLNIDDSMNHEEIKNFNHEIEAW